MKKPQLFLLHFAGGNRYSYNFLTHLLTDFEVIPLELPGRGKRINEKLLSDFELASKDIYNQIIGKLTSRDFFIYGHSMGAIIALRVADLLKRENQCPVCIIVSGNAGPGTCKSKKRYLLEKDEFLSELKKLGGISKEMLENEEMLNFFEPILRADFEIVEKYDIENEIILEIPLFGMMGSEEENSNQIGNWNKFSKIHFSYEIIEGDHFFIYKHGQKIANLIKEFYCKAIDIQQQNFNFQWNILTSEKEEK